MLNDSLIRRDKQLPTTVHWMLPFERSICEGNLGVCSACLQSRVQSGDADWI